MSGIFGGAPASTAPNYTGLQVQTAVNTLPIPIMWGMAKGAPNLIWYNGFFSAPAPSSGGGKGGNTGSGNKNYYADIILALCEGPIAAVNYIWRGQSLYSLAQLTSLQLFLGSNPQSVWSYLASKYPGQARAYQGTAYLAGAQYPLTSSATLDNHNIEVMGLRYGTGYGQTRYPSYGIEIFP